MTKDDFMRGVRKKLIPIESQINDINFLEVLNKIIESKEMEVFIEGDSDDRIHEHDIRVELIVLYKVYDMIEKENRKRLFWEVINMDSTS